MPAPAEKHFTDRIRMGIARRWLTRPHVLDLAEPIISFHFDDFPVSAVDHGAEILQRHGHRATYYLSTSLYDYEDDAGRYADDTMVRMLIAEGHCIGCHTHGHIDLLHSSASQLEADLERYRQAFKRDFPIREPRTFSYPYGLMNLRSKKFVAARFDLARGVRRGINHGKIDLANLCANELAGAGTIEKAVELIKENAQHKGLLIFFTHDVREAASKYGCKPEDFERIVAEATSSGAKVLTMDQIADLLNRPGT